MTYGVRTWSADGVLEMDTDSFTYQVLHNQAYQLNGSNTITASVAGFTPATGVAVILPISTRDADFSSGSMPYMTVGNGTVTVRSRNPSEPGSIGSSILFRLLVMRFG